MSSVRFECDCGEVFETKKFYKVSVNGQFEAYKAICPTCRRGVKNTGEELPPERGARNTYAPKRKDRDRPPVVPANLHKLLEEEKRLRQEQQDEVDSSTAEGDDP